MRGLKVFCADVGSVKTKRFGWACVGPSAKWEGGTDIHAFARAIADHIGTGSPAALGFEAPMFVPLRDDPMQLLSARVGEGSRPWSAGAGCGALAAGIAETTWILREIRRAVADATAARTATATTDWPEFARRGSGLFLWEAFVSGSDKPNANVDTDPHVADALVAARAFSRALPNPTTANAIHEASVVSLLGLAMLRTGWTEDPAVLTEPCIVLRPTRDAG